MTPATHARPGRNTLVDSFYRLASANAAAHSPSQKTEPVAAPVLLRKLPVVPPPVHYETVESYLGRLEKGNQLRNHDLINGFQRNKDRVDHLASFTGRTKEHLALALPEVADALHGSPRRPLGEQLTRPHRSRPYCRRCAASKGATIPVSSWLPVAYRGWQPNTPERGRDRV